LLDIAPEYQRYMDSNETVLVQLDKALYGCVEAAALWYENLSSALIADGFCPNEYDQCVFNKTCADGEQITLVLHVDDLMVTSAGEANLDAFSKYLRTVYPEVTEKRGRVVNYVGMTFDYTVAGQVSVTMDQCVKDILNGCGVVSPKSTPATREPLRGARGCCEGHGERGQVLPHPRGQDALPVQARAPRVPDGGVFPVEPRAGLRRG